MSLTEKFKKTLGISNLNENGNDNSEIDNNLYLKSKTSIPSLNSKEVNVDKFQDLATVTIEKIKKNPFWGEYTLHSQASMISKYFDNKIKRVEYSGIKYSLNDKYAFIDSVLKSVD